MHFFKRRGCTPHVMSYHWGYVESHFHLIVIAEVHSVPMFFFLGTKLFSSHNTCLRSHRDLRINEADWQHHPSIPKQLPWLYRQAVFLRIFPVKKNAAICVSVVFGPGVKWNVQVRSPVTIECEYLLFFVRLATNKFTWRANSLPPFVVFCEHLRDPSGTDVRYCSSPVEILYERQILGIET